MSATSRDTGAVSTVNRTTMVDMPDHGRLRSSTLLIGARVIRTKMIRTKMLLWRVEIEDTLLNRRPRMSLTRARLVISLVVVLRICTVSVIVR